jgi:Ca-activated chloride channel family protein
VPSAPLADKAAVRERVAAIFPGGMTNFSGGLLRGLQEAERAMDGAGATCIVLSDGYANQGVVDHDALGTLTAGARRKGISTSTIGLGLDYDEGLLTAVSRGGAGDAHFAEDGDAAGAALAGEVDGLLERVAQAATVTIRPTGDVDKVTLFNDLDAAPVEGGIMIELGDFFAGEERKLLLELEVPAMAGLGLAQIAEIELRWVELPSLTQKTVTLPLHVNVLPGDEAAGRIPNPVVHSERAFQTAQQAKRDAATAMRHGDGPAAATMLACAAAVLPPEHADEAQVLHDLADRALHDDLRRTAKFSEADAHLKNRRRGR